MAQTYLFILLCLTRIGTVAVAAVVCCLTVVDDDDVDDGAADDDDIHIFTVLYVVHNIYIRVEPYAHRTRTHHLLSSRWIYGHLIIIKHKIRKSLTIRKQQ